MKIITPIKKNLDKIPTRFDDIQKEIQQEKMQKYFEQQIPEIKKGSYKLGNILGKVLDKFA